MSFYKKLALSVFALLVSFSAQSFDLFNNNDSIKKTAALFSHNHPIFTSLFFNTLFFGSTGLLRNRPFKRCAFFTSSTALGAFFAQNVGHNYLQSKFIPHTPKVHFPLCATTCNKFGSKGINQFAAEHWEKFNQ